MAGLGMGAGGFTGDTERTRQALQAHQIASQNNLARKRLKEQKREFDATQDLRERSFAASEEQRGIDNDLRERSFASQEEQRGINNDFRERGFAAQEEQRKTGNDLAERQFAAKEEQRGIDNARRNWEDDWTEVFNQQKADEFAQRREQFDLQMSELRQRKADIERQRQARQDAANSALGVLVREMEENGGQFNSPEALELYGRATGQKVNGSARDEKGGIILFGDGQNPDGTPNNFTPVGYISSEFQRNALSEYFGPDSDFAKNFSGGGASGGASGGGITENQRGRLELGRRRLDRQERKDLLDDFRDDLNRLYKARESAGDERAAEIDRKIADIEKRREKVRRGLDPYADDEEDALDGDGSESASSGQHNLESLLQMNEEDYKKFQEKNPRLANISLEDFHRIISSRIAARRTGDR